MFSLSFKNFMKTACCHKFGNRSFKVTQCLPVLVKTTVEPKEKSSPKIDRTTLELLERLSLVGFESEKSLEIVEDAIRFADQIIEVNTTNIEPLVTVLEDESLYVRKDLVKEDITRKDLMSHCTVSEENYYVAPAGNIEYVSQSKLREEKITEFITDTTFKS